jgi:hypothetical protein
MMEYYYILGAQGCVIIALVPSCWVRGRNESCLNCRRPLHIEGCTYFSIDFLLVTVLSSCAANLLTVHCVLLHCKSVVFDHSIRRNRSRSWCSERSFVVVTCAQIPIDSAYYASFHSALGSFITLL